MRQLQQQNLNDVEIENEAFKKQLGPHILKLTMGELKKLKNLSDAPEGKAMNELNHTIKETLNKTSDEGNFKSSGAGLFFTHLNLI